MKERNHSFTVIHGQDAGPSEFPRVRRQRRAIFMILPIALLAVAGWIIPEEPGSQGRSTSRASETPHASEAVPYFPAQYVNQATEPTEHIQGF